MRFPFYAVRLHLQLPRYPLCCWILHQPAYLRYVRYVLRTEHTLPTCVLHRVVRNYGSRTYGRKYLSSEPDPRPTLTRHPSSRHRKVSWSTVLSFVLYCSSPARSRLKLEVQGRRTVLLPNADVRPSTVRACLEPIPGRTLPSRDTPPKPPRPLTSFALGGNGRSFQRRLWPSERRELRGAALSHWRRTLARLEATGIPLGSPRIGHGTEAERATGLNRGRFSIRSSLAQGSRLRPWGRRGARMADGRLCISPGVGSGSKLSRRRCDARTALFRPTISRRGRHGRFDLRLTRIGLVRVRDEDPSDVQRAEVLGVFEVILQQIA